ncbi:MAG: hypothetical protein U0670_17695 [Anaerolineae bacterium]
MITLMRWRVEGRVIEIHFENHFTLDDLNNAMKLTAQMIAQSGKAPSVHILMYSPKDTVYSKNLLNIAALRDALSKHSTTEDVPLGWTLAVAEAPNQAIWFSSSVVAQLFGLQFLVIPGHPEDGMAYLYRVVRSLPVGAKPLAPVIMSQEAACD